LGELDPPDLKFIFFSGYGSANDDLMRYLSEHFAQYSGGPIARPIVSANRAMLCTFQGKSKNYAIYGPPSNATNLLTQQLVHSEYDLRGGDIAKQAVAVDTIGAVLNSLPGYHSEDTDWSPDYYADLAIKISLRLGHRAQAKAILHRALQLQPNSEELNYMSRILDREVKD
jgi:predicted Zn-dependent protease